MLGTQNGISVHECRYVIFAHTALRRIDINRNRTIFGILAFDVGASSCPIQFFENREEIFSDSSALLPEKSVLLFRLAKYHSSILRSS